KQAKKSVGRPRIHPIPDESTEKRPVGRPRKSPLIGHGQHGGVIFRLMDGRKFKVPSSGSGPVAPIFLQRSPTASQAPSGPSPALTPAPSVSASDILSSPNDSLSLQQESWGWKADRHLGHLRGGGHIAGYDDELDDELGLDGIGDGVGEEEDEEGEGSEDEDEREEGEDVEGGESQGSKALPTRRRRPIPDRIMTKCNRYREESKKTITFDQEDDYFRLRDAAPGQLSPEDAYNEEIMLWDPQPLVKNGIPCPYCRTSLYRHDNIRRPRRFITLTTHIWVTGYRYRCPKCVHPKSGKNTITFRSWNPLILKALPAALSDAFSAMFTHRSGIAKDVFLLMRSCLQRGLGVNQFSDVLRDLHSLAHDAKHLKYLESIIERRSDSMRSGKQRHYASFPLFDDQSDNEDHRHDINQHMAMRSADICAVDHSHKLPKQVIKVGKVRVFNAVLTITNQLGEIRNINLVATKAQSQYELALHEMSKSLTMYGHSQPKLFYTDNMSDKGFLEKSFPSLKEDVIPVEKYGDLEVFSIPDNVTILVKNTSQAIDLAIGTINSDVPVEASDSGLVVGFDAEWNATVSDTGLFTRGGVAVIQIAYQHRVYVLQISSFLSHRRLPKELINFLANPLIRKVGRNVNSDLKQLQDSLDNTPPFCGGVDLAHLAKQRNVISNASASLSDLCAVVLKKCLRKNITARTSAEWEQPNLSEDHVNYAACDAYASLLIYNQLMTLRVPQSLPSNPTPRAPVLIYHSSSRSTVIARGSLARSESNVYDAINLTPTRILVTVHEVFVPAAIMTTHHHQPLSAFGPTPFRVVCLRSHLAVYDPLESELTSSIPKSGTLPEAATPSRVLPMPPLPPSAAESSKQSQATISKTAESPTFQLESAANLDDKDDSDFDMPTSDLPSCGVGSLLQEPDHDALSEPHINPTTSATADHDQESQLFGQQTLTEVDQSTLSTHQTRSRVLKDPFHVFNMLKLSVTHGLRKEFARALRDTLFVPYLEDRDRITAWGATQRPPRTFDQLRLLTPTWLWRRCRRVIPPPEELYLRVKNTFETYGSLKDAATNQPLFNQHNWKIAKQILELIRNGYLSDPPSVSLYQIIGIIGFDKKASNLPIYRCSRGTNFVEGGVHTHLLRLLPTTGVSIRHINARLADFTLVHNLRVGTFASYNLPVQHVAPTTVSHGHKPVHPRTMSTWPMFPPFPTDSSLRPIHNPPSSEAAELVLRPGRPLPPTTTSPTGPQCSAAAIFSPSGPSDTRAQHSQDSRDGSNQSSPMNPSNPTPASHTPVTPHMVSPGSSSTNIPMMLAYQNYVESAPSATTAAVASVQESTRRKERRCWKCFKDCSGRRSTAYCNNECVDCGQSSCRGRNSHRPNYNCQGEPSPLKELLARLTLERGGSLF
ncbi:hypothetical protein CVT24_003845, partial [Panaeolus cyanescens]